MRTLLPPAPRTLGAGPCSRAEDPGRARAGGPVWLRRFVGPFAGVDIDNRETYFVVRDVVHEVVPGELTELELLAEEPHRWWSLAEIAASTQEFALRELAAVLRELLERPWTGPPRIVS